MGTPSIGVGAKVSFNDLIAIGSRRGENLASREVRCMMKARLQGAMEVVGIKFCGDVDTRKRRGGALVDVAEGGN